MTETPTIPELVTEIKAANRAYASGLPYLTDEEYHHLWRQLRKLDPNHPELYHTMKDPSLVDGVPHLFPILGMDKAFESKELKPFLFRYQDDTIRIEPKFDGVGATIYKQPQGWRLVLFGDGRTGRDISKHLPHITHNLTHEVPVRNGELLIPWSKWSPEFGKNPRNVAAGWIARYEIPEPKIIEFIPHEAHPYHHEILPSEYELSELETLLLGLYHTWGQIFPIDGLILKVADPHTRIKASHNGTTYKWCIAWKPPIQTEETTVTSVEWNISRLGRLVPKIAYEAVDLCGTVNTYATANNAEWIKNKGIAPGVKITIGKAGEIIPQIINVSNPVKVSLPSECPVCGGELTTEGVHLLCEDPTCIVKVAKKVAYFYSPAAMDVKNIGYEMVFDLMENDHMRDLLMKKPWALLDMETYQISQAVRKIWGHARTRNFIDSVYLIDGYKHSAHFIAGLGYKSLGYHIALKLLQYIKYDYPLDRIPHTALNGFASALQDLKLAKSELQNFTIQDIPQPPKRFYTITGTLSISRDEMIEYLSKYSWQFVGNVTKSVSTLILGKLNKDSVKLSQARMAGIEIITEDDLINRLKKETDNGPNPHKADSRD